MDQRKVSGFHFDLNSEPENSYYSAESDMSSPVNLNSVPESSNPSFQNQQANSLSVDLDEGSENSFLFIDLNLLPESLYHSDQNQQTDLCFRMEVDNQQDNVLSNNKRPQGDVDKKDEIITKKLKAEREKSRRDRLNDSFKELEDVLEVARYRNTKGSTLDDAIHVLKDLASEVGRLKVENEGLSEESREEKNELRSEKASLKSDIDDLALQFHHAITLMPPWAQSDPPEIAGQWLSYPLAPYAPRGPIRIRSPPPQETIPSHSGSAFSPHLTLVTPPRMERSSTSGASTSFIPGQQDFRSNPSSNEGQLPPEMELMPGSITKFTAEEKGKQPMEDNRSTKGWSSIRMPSSSQGFPGSSSSSMHDI